MKRRGFIQAAAGVALTAAFEPPVRAAVSMPVIDSHIHLFDPTRPGGVPWPEKTDTTLYQPSLPPRYARLAEPHGVVGAIAVECSPWMVDNFWLLDVVEKSEIMLGYIGDLEPDTPDFGATLDRLHRSRFFLGIRYGNLWGRDPVAAARNPAFISGLKLLAEADLVLETANPDAALIGAVVEISDRVPGLRIVLDHLPHADAPAEPSARAAYDAHLSELSKRPQVFVKGSEILRRIDGRVSFDVASYKAALDRLWELFGDNRIFFGSDWPNSDTLANYDETFSVAQHYIATRSATAQQKYFWRNSILVYKWQPRTAAQKRLNTPGEH
jgi:predicted TIM-barrel fold metal-dependent hydrolase